jgi:hypothetical protein
MRYTIYLFVFLLMIGCSEKVEEKIAEKVAEKAIEANTGTKANIDINKESLQITTKDGEMSITSGKSAKVPDNFPKDIPVYNGSVLDMAMEVPQGHSLSFTTKHSMPKVSEWYLKEMISKGWTKEAHMDMKNQTMLVFKKGERGVNLVITPDNGHTRLALTSVKE